MRRRSFGLAAIACTVARTGWTQPSTAKKRVAVFVLVGTASSPAYIAFRRELENLGFAEGRNTEFVFRSAEGSADTDRFASIAAELVQLSPDVVFAPTTPCAVSVQKLSATIPIVFAVSADPIGAGLINSLSLPGRNATGLSGLNLELSSKWVEILRDLCPDLRKVAVLWAGTPSGFAAATLDAILRQTEDSARVLGIEPDTVRIATAEELDEAFGQFIRRGHRAAVMLPSVIYSANMQRIAQLSLTSRIATVGDNRRFVDFGGLASYGVDVEDQYRRAGRYVAKILNGAMPANLPVEQPTKFQLVVNSTTAKALGLVLPASVLARADEVIE